MPQKTVVVLVDVALQDRRLHLAPDAAMRANRCAAYLGRENLGMRADVARPFQAGEGLDDGMLGDDDRAVRRVDDDVRLERGRRVHAQPLAWANDANVRRLIIPAVALRQGG